MANILSIILNASSAGVKKAMKETDGAIKTVEKSIGDFMRKYRKVFLGVAAVVTAASAAMVLGTRSAIKYGLEIDRLRKVTGLSAQAIAKLQFAIMQEHGSVEALSKSIPILARRIIDANDGLETYTRAFDRAGISIKDSNGELKDTEEIFLELSDFMTSGASDTVKMAVAQELLGRSGKELIPIMKLGREEIERLGREAERLGLVMSDEDVKAMKEFDDSLLSAKLAVKGLFIVIASQLSPVLEGIATWAANKIPEMRDEVDSATESAIVRLTAVGGILDKVADSFFWVKTAIKALTTVFFTLFDQWENILGGLVGIVVEQFQKIVHEFRILFSFIASKSNKLFADIKIFALNVISDIISAVIKAGEHTLPASVKKSMGKVIESMRNTQDKARKITSETYDEIRKRLEKDLPENIGKARTMLANAGDQIMKGFSDLLDDVDNRETSFFTKTLGEIRKFITESGEALKKSREETKADIEEGSNDFRSNQKTAWEQYFEGLKTAVADTSSFAVAIWSSTQSAIRNALVGMTDSSRKFRDVVKGFWKDLKASIISAIADMIAKWLIFKAISGFGFGGGGIISKKAGGPIPSFADGGAVPIIAHVGEYVIPKNLVDLIKRTGSIPSDLIGAIQAGRPPKFQAGGAIGGGGLSVDIGGINISISGVPDESVDSLLDRLGDAVENNVVSAVRFATKTFNKGQSRETEAV